MINREFLQNLTPAEIEFISGYIASLVREKVKDDTDNHENLDGAVTHCPKCGSIKYVKYGHNPNNRQKYLCKDCKSVFLSTTGTVFSRSRLSYNDWTSFIAGEINSMTLQQQAIAISKSVTTCFYMRQKLYRAINQLVESQKLSDEIKMDFTYISINLKGTKPENMPRKSKVRGKSDKHNSIKGVSHHKICVFTALDSNDNHIVKIAGLGSESYEKLLQFENYFKHGSTVVCDSKTSNTKFIKHIHCKAELIPSGKHLSKDGNHINDVNHIHSDIKNLNIRYKGISTRHLQDYLTFYCFLKKLTYSIEARRRKMQSYMDILGSDKELLNSDICKIPMPIDLYEAYGEHHYGIFSSFD